MNKDEIISRLRYNDAEINALQAAQKTLLEKLSETVSPYKFGDIMDMQGYSHKGKKCSISRVIARHGWRGSFELSVRGKVLKKDGTVGSLDCEWTEKII